MSQKLTPKQYEAAYLLVLGYTHENVAHRLKLRRETISRWKRQPEFNDFFQNIINESCAGLEQRIFSLADDSIGRIKNELRYEANTKAIDAALNILDRLGVDLKQRLPSARSD